MLFGRSLITHCIKWGFWLSDGGEIWGEPPQPAHEIAICSQIVSRMLPPAEYKREVGLTCQSDSVFYQIILVFVKQFAASVIALRRLRVAVVLQVAASGVLQERLSRAHAVTTETASAQVAYNLLVIHHECNIVTREQV